MWMQQWVAHERVGKTIVKRKINDLRKSIRFLSHKRVFQSSHQLARNKILHKTFKSPTKITKINSKGYWAEEQDREVFEVQTDREVICCALCRLMFFMYFQGDFLETLKWKEKLTLAPSHSKHWIHFLNQHNFSPTLFTNTSNVWTDKWIFGLMLNASRAVWSIDCCGYKRIVLAVQLQAALNTQSLFVDFHEIVLLFGRVYKNSLAVKA